MIFQKLNEDNWTMIRAVLHGHKISSLNLALQIHYNQTKTRHLEFQYDHL